VLLFFAVLLCFKVLRIASLVETMVVNSAVENGMDGYPGKSVAPVSTELVWQVANSSVEWRCAALGLMSGWQLQVMAGGNGFTPHATSVSLCYLFLKHE
jgi:hypothetical protein